MAAKPSNVSAEFAGSEPTVESAGTARSSCLESAQPAQHVSSPALNLQTELGQRLSGVAASESIILPDMARWSARRTLTFIIISNALAWAGLIWAGLALFS